MISVCMATYNGERFVREQLESVLSQLTPDDEVIVADDMSTDATLDVVRKFSDSRIRILPGEEHLGPIYNLERALLASRGEYVFLSDQDDVWLAGKVFECLLGLRDADLVLHDAYFYGQLPDGSWARGKTVFELRPPRHGVLKNWFRNCFTGCCMAFRRSLFSRAIPFPKRLPMHDQWLGLVAEKTGRVRFIDKPLVDYRRHSGNATDLLNGSGASLAKRFKWRFDLLRILFRLSK